MKVYSDLHIGVLAERSCDIGRVVHELCDHLAASPQPE